MRASPIEDRDMFYASFKYTEQEIKNGSFIDAMGEFILILSYLSTLILEIEADLNLDARNQLIKREDFIEVLTFFGFQCYRKIVAEQARKDHRLRRSV